MSCWGLGVDRITSLGRRNFNRRLVTSVVHALRRGDRTSLWGATLLVGWPQTTDHDTNRLPRMALDSKVWAEGGGGGGRGDVGDGGMDRGGTVEAGLCRIGVGR